MKLEDITAKALLTGVEPDGHVEVVAVTWQGSDCVDVIFRKADGNVDSRLLYRTDETQLAMAQAGRPWSFDADGHKFKLASEALRIKLAHLYDERMAVHSSNVQPLPHQITAVYEHMLTRHPLRFLLADDPGAGKTIMAGLLIRELVARGDVQRCLIVCPGGLVEQWQEELDQRFNLHFEIMTNDKLEASRTGNWMQEEPMIIGRLDKMARDESLHEKMKADGCDWDLVIVDEAHKMSASFFGQEIKRTKRFSLGRMLSGRTRHFLLMTATPHNGKEEDFQLFMSLIDGDRFEGKFRDGVHTADVKDMMRRMVKEELLKFDGTPLFPERIAYTLGYDLSDDEATLYEEVTTYVREQYNRADRLENGNRKGTVGFALTMLQRRLASSPEAITRSLERRVNKLEERLSDLEFMARTKQIRELEKFSSEFDEDQIEDLMDGVGEEEEESLDAILDQSTASETKEELQAEVQILKSLLKKAKAVRRSGNDMKWTQLSGLLNMVFTNPDFLNKVRHEDIPFGGDNAPAPEASPHQKLVIFTEHKDTLNYLQKRIDMMFGQEGHVVAIHGSVKREDRLRAQERFKFDPDIRILLATDAAGEGINLQRAHLMVNYDLPWNPNRLEQRFGRIHRIGQKEVCHLWNLVARETREGDVYTRLFEKLEQARSAMGGKVFDVLGKMQFDGKPLKELLVEAIRYGNDPEVRAKLSERVATAMDTDYVRELLEERALVHDAMDTTRVERIRADMDRASMRRLQPHFIAGFFRAAFAELGGGFYKREQKRLEITRVPGSVLDRDRVMGNRAVVLKKYERIAFSKEDVAPEGQVRADFVCPGHPLLDAVVDLTLEKNRSLLKQGTMLVDPVDIGTQPRLVFYLEHAILDGQTTRQESKRTIAKQVMFVEKKKDGGLAELQFAPYLDFEPLPADGPSVDDILARPESEWIQIDPSEEVRNHVATTVVPHHLEEVRKRRLDRIAKERNEVQKRLFMEIQHWDHRAITLEEQEAKGKVNAKVNAKLARQRADDLTDRLERRMAELQREEHIVPGKVNLLGGIVVVPKGLLMAMEGQALPANHSQTQVDRMAIAAQARNIVIELEQEFGRITKDVEFEHKGWDVESEEPGGRVRFIEVKGRNSMAETISVTKNEILQGRNNPDQYILAMVLFDQEGGHEVRYLPGPWSDDLDFTTTRVEKDLNQLWAQAHEPN